MHALHWVIVFPVGLLVAQSCAADDYRLVFTRGVFNVIDGVPHVFTNRELPSGNAVVIRGPSLVHYASGENLAYPLREQPSPVITLGMTDETSASWDIFEGRRGRIRAAEGAYKGWYLDYAADEIDITYKGAEFRGRRLVLVKDPKEPREFAKYEVSK